MHGASKAVKKPAVYAAVFKQLAHILQRVHRVLHGLCGKAVHQVSVHQHTGTRKALCHARYLRHGHAFLHQRQQAVGSHFQAARHGNATALSQ